MFSFNPFDRLLNKAKKNCKNVLLFWNRGLGDIATGLYAIVLRIKEFIPDAKIIFITRENLLEGFSLLGETAIGSPSLKRHVPYDAKKILQELNLDPSSFDLIIENPDPTRWVARQRGKTIPKLKWDPSYDRLADKFSIEKGEYIAMQPFVESGYALFRDWPKQRIEEFLFLFEKTKKKALLFGFEKKELFPSSVNDLRGKTSILEMLALIRRHCTTAVLPDSSLLCLLYYLDVPWRLKILSLWGDPKHGILKQSVLSPNPLLLHIPLIAKKKELSLLSANEVFSYL